MKALLYLKGRDLKILSVWKIKHENTAWHLIQKEQDEMKEQANLHREWMDERMPLVKVHHRYLHGDVAAD